MNAKVSANARTKAGKALKVVAIAAALMVGASSVYAEPHGGGQQVSSMHGHDNILLDGGLAAHALFPLFFGIFPLVGAGRPRPNGQIASPRPRKGRKTVKVRRGAARARFGIPDGAVCVLVFGGSLGARAINFAAVASALPLSTDALVQLARNSFQASFLDDRAKASHLAEIDALT